MLQQNTKLYKQEIKINFRIQLKKTHERPLVPIP